LSGRGFRGLSVPVTAAGLGAHAQPFLDDMDSVPSVTVYHLSHLVHAQKPN